jgi:hypothetical protein
VGLHLSQIDEADELLTSDPLALLIGMVLDRQIGQTMNRSTSYLGPRPVDHATCRRPRVRVAGTNSRDARSTG